MTGTYARLVRAEWTKLRSVRSTGWTLTAMVISSIGLTALLCAVNAHDYATMSASDRAMWDPTNQSLVGTLTGQIAVGVFGVLAVTAEFATGTIRSSLMAVPSRTPVTWAKVAVYGVTALVVGEVSSFGSFLVGQAVMSGHAPTATLGQPHVARAVAMTGVYCAAVCVIAIGLGLIVRHTAAAITGLVVLFLVVPGVIGALPQHIQQSIGRFVPEQVAANSFAAVVPEAHALSVVAGLVVLAGYALALCLAGNLLLRRQDV